MSGLSGIRACVFDAYGTLFDFASAAGRCDGVPTERRQELTSLWRDKQLQYTWLRTLQGRYIDFWQVTGDALDYALETLRLAKPGLRAKLMDLYLELEAFPESPQVLRELKARGFVTAILSNGSPEMLKSAVERAELAGLLDAILSVDSIKAYKTHPAAYQYAVDQLGAPATAFSYQSSNAWDAYAASDFGMRVIWCNRYGQAPERLPGKPDFEVASLAQLPALLI